MIITNLLTNMVIATFTGVLPTNIVSTPALNDHAFQILYARARKVSSQLHLDEGIVNTNKVTHFKVLPCAYGPVASIGFDGRYYFGIRGNGSLNFSDGTHHQDAIIPTTSSTDMEAASKQLWLAFESFRFSTNHLTLRKARRIAKTSAKAFGVDVDRMPGFRRVKNAEQMMFDDTRVSHFEPDGTVVIGPKENGVVYPLPYYTFGWERRFPSFAVCRVEVSGVSSNVVSFSYVGPSLKLSKPDHYLEMLGLPPDTVFVRPRTLSPGTYEVVGPGTD